MKKKAAKKAAKRPSPLERTQSLARALSLALEVAALANRDGGWYNPSPFQDRVNELLVMAGRSPVLPKPAAREGGGE
jgi:hypothetical protein